MRGRHKSSGGGKRQKELRRAERQEAKAERKAQRRGEKQPASGDDATDPKELLTLAAQYRNLVENEPADRRADRLKMAEYLEHRAAELEEAGVGRLDQHGHL
jgi:hypothetical protein